MSAIGWTAIENAIAAWCLAGSSLATGQVIWSYQAGPRPEPPYLALSLTNVRPGGQDWRDRKTNPLVIPDDVVDGVDAIANSLELVAHGLLTGDGPIRLTTTGVLPGGLAIAIDYWVVKADADNIQIASSFANAMAAIAIAVDLTTVGSGVHTLHDTAATVRAGKEIRQLHRGPRQATLDLQLFAAGAIGETGAVAQMHDTLAAIDIHVDALNTAGIGVGEVGPVQLVAGRVNTLLEPRATASVELHLFSELESYATYIEHVQLLIKAPPSADAIELLV